MAARLSGLLVAVVAASTTVLISAPQGTQSPPTQTPGSPQTQAPATPDTTFKVDVSVMTLSVTVIDDKGKSVAGLKQEDFVLLEDGKQRPITGFRATSETTESRVPLGLGLVLDVSGSMTDDRLGAMRTAVQYLIEKRLSKEDEVYFVEFASDARLIVPWTTDRKAIVDAIRKVKTRSGTAIYDAMAAALPVSAQGKHKKQVMLVITDGGDTHSKVSRPKLAEAARSAEVIIYTLVVDGEEALARGDTSNLRQAAGELSQITDVTGGRTQYVRGFQELENAIGAFGRDVSAQYEISFERTAEKDGKFHPVRVGVRRPNLTVRHKLGYVAN